MIPRQAIHRLFFTLPGFFPSLKKSYALPSYVVALASTFASNRNMSTRKKSSNLDPRVLQFLDVGAIELEKETSSFDSSGHS